MIVVINKKEKQMAFNTNDNIFLEMAEIQITQNLPETWK